MIDNALNNNIIIFNIKNALRNFNLEIEFFNLFLFNILFNQHYISYLAHVIQLFLKIFLFNFYLILIND